MNTKQNFANALLSILSGMTLILSAAQPVITSASAEDVPERSKGNYMFRGSYPLYHDLVLDEIRGWIYGSDPAGRKIDVIRISDFRVIKSFNFADTAPRGIALSPDGTELVVANNGTGETGSILFLNSVTGALIATVVPDVGGRTLNKPWDVIYGRSDRLYSSGTPGAEGLDYIHVIDTVTHTEVGRSTYVIRFTPALAITSDKNYVYANDVGTIPEKIYKLDVTTDVPTLITTTPHGSKLEATTFLLAEDDSQIFTNTGQAWRGDLSGLLGNTGQTGGITLLPNRKILAFSIGGSETDSIAFYRTTDYYGIKKYSFPDIGSMGPMVASSDGNKLYVSGSSGFAAIDLSSGIPGTTIGKPAGSLPYFDMIEDEARNVLYGSNPTGHRVDVLSISTSQVVKRFRLVNGAFPAGIALSPDGSELAIAQYGASSILFLNPETGAVISKLDTYGVESASSSLPYDLIYGRAGRLYMVGNPGAAYGFDYIHIINTATHTDIGLSSELAYMGPRLEISRDKRFLYVNQGSQLPAMLNKYDVSTDTIGPPVNSTNYNWAYDADTFIVPGNESRVFTDHGQVWNNTFRRRLATFSPGGYLGAMPTRNAFVSANDNQVTFFSLGSYAKLGSHIMIGVTKSGPVVVKSDNSVLFVSTDKGVKKINPANILPILPLTTRSSGIYDGRVLESSETSNTGGTMSVTGTLNVGDNSENKQNISLLHFNTASLPDTATITNVTIKIKKQGITGTDPFTTHGNLTVDIYKGCFGACGLELTDFQRTASKYNAGVFIASLLQPGWYQLVLGANNFRYINLKGATQFRLHFMTDDNNDNGNDYIRFFSGESSVPASDRPIMIIEYDFPN